MFFEPLGKLRPNTNSLQIRRLVMIYQGIPYRTDGEIPIFRLQVKRRITRFPPLTAVQHAKFYPAGSRKGDGFLHDWADVYIQPTLLLETWGSEEFLAEGRRAEEGKEILERAGIPIAFPRSW